MKYKIKNFTIYLLLSLMLVFSIYIFIYYLLADELKELRFLSPLLIVSILLYIVCQLLKRKVRKKTPWYNWFYPLGIIAVLIPLFLFNNTQGDWIFVVTQVGSLLFLFPPFIEILTFRRYSHPTKIEDSESTN